MIRSTGNMSHKAVDIYNRNVFSFRWLGVWLEVLGGLIVLFCALFTVIAHDTVTGGLVGLSLSYALSVSCFFLHLFKIFKAFYEQLNLYCAPSTFKEAISSKIKNFNLVWLSGNILTLHAVDIWIELQLDWRCI